MTNTALTFTVVLIAIAFIAVIAAVILRQRRSDHLRRRFGNEYDRMVKETGSREKAEAALEERQRRVERLNLRPLTREDSARFSQSWSSVQARFVDDPKGAVTEADRLLGEVMGARGYPVGDFDQRAADISVHHPTVVEHYRAGHNIALRHARGEANTEDLRQAMIHYRALFTELVGERDMGTTRMAEAPEEKTQKRGIL